ncbi:MAG: hypothetical protein KUG72_09045 [Pseudomonadales bacterium]|nr:hypothetical protein [Pseudomonadales bacterium]
MNRIKYLLKIYLIAAGISIHILALGTLLVMPDRVRDVYYRVYAILEEKIPLLKTGPAAVQSGLSIEEEISLNFDPWKPLATREGKKTGIWINDSPVKSLKAASKAVRNGDVLTIGEGVYHEPLVIRANDVKVVGVGHVVIENTAAEGKGAIITKGNNTQIKNIECRNVKVRDRNGACVRHEGSGLTLTHVYFHHSQQGLLAGGKSGHVLIEDSRFERLGLAGRAHGIYVNGGVLTLRNSMVLASKDQGHEVKSRAAVTTIENSVIASLSSGDSRLIDVPSGGVLTIKNSVLQKGVSSTNQDLIGYGLEKRGYSENRVLLADNLILMERTRGNMLFHKHGSLPDAVARNNVIIAREEPQITGVNVLFEDRSEAGLADYPMLPKFEK